MTRKQRPAIRTIHMERDGKWFIAYSRDIPGANGQGKSEEECLRSLADAIELLKADAAETPNPAGRRRSPHGRG